MVDEQREKYTHEPVVVSVALLVGAAEVKRTMLFNCAAQAGAIFERANILKLSLSASLITGIEIQIPERHGF